MNSLTTKNLHSATPVLSVIDSRGLQIRSVAYYRSRPAAVAEERITRQSFDTAGRLEAIWDPRLLSSGGGPNLASQRSLSNLPLMTNSVDAGWRAMMMGRSGEIRSEWDGRHFQRHIDYDDLLRPITVTVQSINELPSVTDRMTYAGSDIESALHNQCGNLIRHDDTAGCLCFDEYGLSGLKLSESRRFMNELPPLDWPKALVDRDKKLEDEAAKTQWRFDSMGNMLVQIDARHNQQLFSYDVTGGVKHIELKRNGLPKKTLLSNMQYSATGQIECEIAGNGVETTWRYEIESGRLLKLTSRRPDRIFQEYIYTYDPVGNIIGIRDAAQPVRYFRNQRTEPENTFTYDTLYQLIEATGRESIPTTQGPELPELQTPVIDPQRMSHYKQTFSYDSAGNLQTLVHQGNKGYTRHMVTAPESNRSLIKTEDGGDPDFTNNFDTNGNLLTSPLTTSTLNWNAKNQLSEVTLVTRLNEQNDNEVYHYDANASRSRKIRKTKTQSGVITSEVRYLPGLEILYENLVEKRYVVNVELASNNVRLLHWSSTLPKNTHDDQIRYSFSDHLGGSTLELDEDAGILSQEGYYPFGGTAWWAARNEIEAKYKTVRYSGKERDSSGLYYYGYRYYAPWLSRWISTDPAGMIDGSNLYSFVRNNPITLRDHNGLEGTNLPSAKQRAMYNWQRLSSKLPSHSTPVKVNTIAPGMLHVHIQATESRLQSLGITLPRQTELGRTLDYISIDSSYQSTLAGADGLTKLKAMSAGEIYAATNISGAENIAYINGAFFNMENRSDQFAPQHATIGESSIGGAARPSLPIPGKYSDLYTKVALGDNSSFYSAPLLSQGGNELFTAELSSQSRHKFDPNNNLPGYISHAGDANARSAISMPTEGSANTRTRLILGSTVSSRVPNDPGYTMEEWSTVTNRLDKLNGRSSRSINLDGGASTVLGAINNQNEFLLNIKTNRDLNRGLANFIVFYK